MLKSLIYLLLLHVFLHNFVKFPLKKPMGKKIHLSISLKEFLILSNYLKNLFFNLNLSSMHLIIFKIKNLFNSKFSEQCYQITN